MKKTIWVWIVLSMLTSVLNLHAENKRKLPQVTTAKSDKKVSFSPTGIQATTVNILPGETKSFSRKTTGGATVGSYSFEYNFPAGITAYDTEVWVNTIYQVVMEFDISVPASTPANQTYSGYVAFDLYEYNGDLKKTMTYEFDILTSANQPPTLSNATCTPSSGHTTTQFRFAVTYKDPDGDPPPESIHVTLNPNSGNSTTFIMVEGTGDNATGKEYYQTYNGYNFRFGPNDYIVSIGISWNNPTLIIPSSGTFTGPVVHDLDFEASPKTGTAPLTVQFSDESIDSIDPWDWNWDFGDGSTSREQNPVHTYTVPGTYTVTANAVCSGIRDEITKTSFITVASPAAPVANFSGTPTSGTKPLTVQFTDQSSGSITSRSWNFGDGTTSTQTNPSHTYNNTGTYTVILTVIGPGGSNTKTRSSYITVSDVAPVANFSGTPTSGTKPLTVQFTDQSSGSITSRSWNFGDGATSTQTNPSHTYNNTGTYTVILTVTGPGGSNTKTRSSYITVSDVAPVANFSGTPTSGTKPLTVQFTDQSSGSITSRSWNFGDGTTSTQTNPSHTYNNTGTYTVILTVIGPGGSNTKTRSSYITVSEPTAIPVANFSGTPTSGTKPLTVQFTDQSSGSITSRSWNFGDGATSSQTNPSHTYNNTGTYTVMLTVTGPGGSNTKTRSSYITVSEPAAAPVANFSGVPTSGTKPLTVQFTDQSSGSITSRSWNFGDGVTSSQTNPSHTYNNTGTYTVMLTVTGPGGSNTKTRSSYITVSEPAAVPVANFSGNPTSGNAPLTVQFADNSSGDITSYEWTYDGRLVYEKNPKHTFSNPGQYTVQLKVVGPGGQDTEIKNNFITVLEAAPVANFSASPTSGQAPLTVQFAQSATGRITSYEWTYDGQLVYEKNPTHTFTAPGKYTVQLKVTGPGGSSTKLRTDYIIISQPTGIVDSEDFQGEYKLFQNYPNPFNPSTILSFSLAEQGNANIKIYNLSGQVIQTVLNEYLSAGIHKVKWTPKDLPGGIYLSVLRVGQFTQTRKIMYVK